MSSSIGSDEDFVVERLNAVPTTHLNAGRRMILIALHQRGEPVSVYRTQVGDRYILRLAAGDELLLSPEERALTTTELILRLAQELMGHRGNALVLDDIALEIAIVLSPTKAAAVSHAARA